MTHGKPLIANLLQIKDDLTPEQLLLFSIVSSAIREADLDYFFSNTFEDHCDLLFLDHQWVRRICFNQMELME